MNKQAIIGAALLAVGLTACGTDERTVVVQPAQPQASTTVIQPTRERETVVIPGGNAAIPGNSTTTTTTTR